MRSPNGTADLEEAKRRYPWMRKGAKVKLLRPYAFNDVMLPAGTIGRIDLYENDEPGGEHYYASFVAEFKFRSGKYGQDDWSGHHVHQIPDGVLGPAPASAKITPPQFYLSGEPYKKGRYRDEDEREAVVERRVRKAMAQKPKAKKSTTKKAKPTKKPASKCRTLKDAKKRVECEKAQKSVKSRASGRKSETKAKKSWWKIW